MPTLMVVKCLLIYHNGTKKKKEIADKTDVTDTV